jgi:hypothetical protein
VAAFAFISSRQRVRMCSLLMRLQRSASVFNSGRFAVSWHHAQVNQKAHIAAAMQNVQWARMKSVPMKRNVRTGFK